MNNVTWIILAPFVAVVLVAISAVAAIFVALLPILLPLWTIHERVTSGVTKNRPSRKKVGSSISREIKNFFNDNHKEQ
jgi:hypothetical protein